MNRAFAVVRSAFFAALFFWLWTWLVPRWMFRVDMRVVHPSAWGLIVAGGALALWCVFEFAWRGRGTPMPLDPPRRLVVSGLYRHVRNPMYLGFGVALAGEAILVGRVELLYELLAFAAMTAIFVVGYEERALRSTFGDDYRAYCAAVPRWLPRLSGRA